MRKRGGIILVGALVTVLVGLLCWAWGVKPSGPADRVYDGERLSTLVNQDSGIPVLDSNAVPYLVHALGTRDSALAKKYIGLWHRLPVWLQFRMAAPHLALTVRARSCDMLSTLQASARPAIPELMRVLREDEDWEVRSAAAYALGEIADRNDKSVIEALVAATKDKEPTVSFNAGIMLHYVDPQAATKIGLTNFPTESVPAAGHLGTNQ